MAEDLAQKKLRGSGGYAIAMITDDEQKKGNLGGPELFLAGVGRLDEDRFVKYYCNKCEKEYEGSPSVVYDNPGEELGEGVTLVEKGEYRCKTCNSTIANYRRFETAGQATEAVREQAPATPRPELQVPTADPGLASDGFVSIQSLVGMSAYDSEAVLLGKVDEVGLRKSPATGVQVALKIAGKEVPWSGISKIGDIVLLASSVQQSAQAGKCPLCGYQNEAGSAFCEQCGSKL